MAKNALYVANLAASVDERRLHDLFGEYGEVESVEFGTHELSGDRFALVALAVEKAATKANHGLNGREIDGCRLAVSYPEVDVTRELVPKHRKLAEAVCEELGETEKVPVRRIHTMVLLCGTSFVEAILEEAKQVAAGEGIKTTDGSRPRTVGGVFFYLARYRMSNAVRRIVYNRKGKMPAPEQEIVEESETPESE